MGYPLRPLEASAPSPRSDGLLALLLALPALALVAPLGLPPGAWPPLIGDPSPEPTAAGWLALATLPALAALLLRGAAARPRELYALLAAWLVAAIGFQAGTDRMGADRVSLTLTAGAALVVAGATLGPRGRAVLCLHFALLGLALVATAGSAPSAYGLPGWAGLVGNTGDLSEAALPAGVLGLGVFLYGGRWLRPLGLAAALAHALYAGLVPVHAGSLGWLAVAACAFAAAPGRPEAKRLARLALIAAAVAVVTAGGRVALARAAEARRADAAAVTAPASGGAAASATTAPNSGALDRGAPAAETAELGGAPFRIATWRATLGLIAARPFGVGGGQFQAAFPPYRDRGELERSSHGRREPTPQEVEHPHNDWLLAFAELGWLGGGAFALFLLLVARRALGALRGADPVRATFGLAALAVLVNAVFNSPLLDGTLSAALAWPIFGAVLAPTVPSASGTASAGQRSAGQRLARAVPILFTLLLALQARTAWSLVQHGRALSALPAARVVVDGREQVDGVRLEALLGRALAARPDSVPALEKRHELLLARGAPLPERRALLERILAQRPRSFSARLSLGNLEAAAGRYADAAEQYQLAAAVDAGHPALIANRLTLALDRRDVDATRAAVLDARGRGLLSGADLERRIGEQLLRGRLEVAEVLSAAWAPTPAEGEPRYDPTDANDAYQASARLRAAGHELMADGFSCAFHVLMARDNRARGQHESAIAMARQALRRAEIWPELPGTDGALRLELAVAQLAAANVAAAREVLARAPIPAVDLFRLPEADTERLISSGLIAIRAGAVVVADE